MERNKILNDNQQILKSSYTIYETSMPMFLKETNNKLENIFRDQQKYKMQHRFGKRPNKTSKNWNKETKFKKLMDSLSIRLYTAEEIMNDLEDRSEEM